MPPINPVEYEGKAAQVIDRYRRLERDKQPWYNTYQLIGEYVMTRKQNFTETHTQGEILTDQLSDSTAGKANHLMASSLIGALFPNGAKTFQILPPDGRDYEDLLSNDDCKKYYEYTSRQVARVLDNPKGGFVVGLESYFLDQGAFGLSGITVSQDDDDPDTPILFTAEDCKGILISEGKNGFIDTVYIRRELTVRQLVLTYGLDRVSSQVREKYNRAQFEEKVKIICALEPRLGDDRRSIGNKGFPIASLHVELETKKVLRESGFHEMPTMITRFWKAAGEVYGRSPAMEAMPDILEVNAMRDAADIAIEKSLDPPLAMFHDGTAGGGTVDTSAGAFNIFQISGKMGALNQRFIEPIVTVGEMNSTYKRISELKEDIFNAFFADRLTDLNSNQRMTAEEVRIRNEMRGQSLNTIYARQIAELFTPLIERVFNILFDIGWLGVIEGSIEHQIAMQKGQNPYIIPDQIAQLMVSGQNVFRIKFISPAARTMQAEEVQGMEATVFTAIKIAAESGDTSILDNIDFDIFIRRYNDLKGGASDIIRSLDDVSKIRADRAQNQAQMQQMQAQQIGAEIEKDTAQARKSNTQAGIPIQALVGGAA